MNLFTKQKHTDLENKLMFAKGEREGDKLGFWDQQIQTTILDEQ